MLITFVHESTGQLNLLLWFLGGQNEKSCGNWNCVVLQGAVIWAALQSLAHKLAEARARLCWSIQTCNLQLAEWDKMQHCVGQFQLAIILFFSRVWWNVLVNSDITQRRCREHLPYVPRRAVDIFHWDPVVQCIGDYADKQSRFKEEFVGDCFKYLFLRRVSGSIRLASNWQHSLCPSNHRLPYMWGMHLAMLYCQHTRSFEAL